MTPALPVKERRPNVLQSSAKLLAEVIKQGHFDLDKKKNAQAEKKAAEKVKMTAHEKSIITVMALILTIDTRTAKVQATTYRESKARGACSKSTILGTSSFIIAIARCFGFASIGSNSTPRPPTSYRKRSNVSMVCLLPPMT